MNAILTDLRHACRSLARSRGTTTVAVLTLALGIGANTAIFAVVDAVLLRPLPFGDPDRLVSVFEHRNGGDGQVSGHEFVAWREQVRTHVSLTTYMYGGFNLTGGGEPEAIRAIVVASDFFDVLGLDAQLGRTFTPGEDRAGRNRVVILSSAFWRRRFAADAAVVGRTITLNDQPYEIVGVMGPRGEFDPEVWVPLDLASEVQRVGRHAMRVIGRLKDVTLPEAQAALDVAARQVERAYPQDNAGHGVRVASLAETVVGDAREPVLLASGAVGFVLLIACANVAHLLLTRSAARRKELAIRAALGASRLRLIQQLLTETLLVAFIGGGVGVLLAWWLVDLVPAIDAMNIPRLGEAAIDGRVIAAALALTLLTALLSGLVPALRGARAEVAAVLADAPRGTSGGQGRLGSMLVVSELAIAIVLLIGAGLMIRTLVRVSAVSPGFDARNVLSVPLGLPASRYPKAVQQRDAFAEIVQRTGRVPGVVAAAATDQLPFSGAENIMPLTVEGQPPQAAGDELRTAMRVVSTDYFRAMGIPVIRGRVFTDSDARVAVPLIRWYPQQPNPPYYDEPQAPPVAVINETAARRFWPGRDPIGSRIQLLFSPWTTVIGVVGDVRHGGLMAEAPAEVYLCNLQEPRSAMTLVARTEREPLAPAAAVRAQIHAVDPDLPMGPVRTLDELVARSIDVPRFDALMLGQFGAVALFLSAIGIYGVMSHMVGARRREIGIRASLGARRVDVLRLVLGRAVLLTAAGVAIGSAGAFVLTRLMVSLLYDVTPTDPLTFAAAAMLLSAVALSASYIPASRALKIDPITAMRE